MRYSQFFATIVAWHRVLQVSAHERALKPSSRQTEPCTLLKLQVQFKDGSSQSKWQCELSDADASVALQYFVDVEGLTNEDLNGIRSGANSLFIEGGYIVDGKLTIAQDAKKEFGKVERSRHLASNQVNGQNEVHVRRLTDGVVDKRSVLAVRVTTPDSKPNITLLDMKKFIFGAAGDVSNLKERFNSCTYGEVLMEPFNGTTLTNKTVSNGVFAIAIGLNATGEYDFNIVFQVQNKLNALLGNLIKQFDHVMLCLPPGILTFDDSSDWISSGHVYGFMSYFNNDACKYPSVQVHEIGHNLGLLDSDEGDVSRGDNTCMMGNPGYGNNTMRMCFNPAQSYQLRWYSLRTITLDFSQRPGFNGKLIGINHYKHPASAGKYVIVRILGSPYYQRDVYVGWNLAQGINADTQEAKNQVTVYTKWPIFSESNLVAKLSAKQNFTLPDFTGIADLLINVKSISGAAASLPYADVDIYVTGCPPGTCGAACNNCCVTADCPPADPCAFTSCDGNTCIYDLSSCEGNFTLTVHSDQSIEEMSWELFDRCRGKVIVRSDSYSTDSVSTLSFRSSLLLGQAYYTFTMRDKAGDGLYNGPEIIGNFTATFDGTIVSKSSGDYGYAYSSDFGGMCP